MRPQPRKVFRSPKTSTRNVDPLTDLGIGLVGTMMMKTDDSNSRRSRLLFATVSHLFYS